MHQLADEAVIFRIGVHLLCCHDAAERVEEILLGTVFDLLQLFILITVHDQILVRIVYRKTIYTISRIAVVVYDAGPGCISDPVKLFIAGYLLFIVSLFEIREVTDHIYLLFVCKLICT